MIELGACDLSQAGEYTYRLKNLPPKQLVFGINVVSDEPLLVDLTFKDEVRVSTVVTINVTNERNELVIAQRRRLDEWVWSGRGGSVNESFLWIDGTIACRDLGNGMSVETAVGHSADLGWGTCLKPRFFGDYVARITVDIPDPRAKSLRAMMLLTGGGM